MYISGIQYNSIVDGEGIRNTLFISGCMHYCEGCHNPKTWDFNYGYEFTEELQDDFINNCKENILLDGITLSGGDPVYSTKELVPFLIRFKEECPNLSIWLYTGFRIEEMKDSELLDYCDVVVDGPFSKELRDTTLDFRGSKNQRIIYLKKQLTY